MELFQSIAEKIAARLIERGQTVASAAYMIASVVLSVGALIAALHVVRAFP